MTQWIVWTADSFLRLAASSPGAARVEAVRRGHRVSKVERCEPCGIARKVARDTERELAATKLDNSKVTA
jgi:hypothetical protein